MIFELQQNIFTIDGTIWVSSGQYALLRYFDEHRVLIDVGTSERQLVVVALRKGRVHNVNEQ